MSAAEMSVAGSGFAPAPACARMNRNVSVRTKAVLSASSFLRAGGGVNLADDAVHQTAQRLLVKGDQDPGPGKSPEERQRPGDGQVLIQRQAWEPGCGMLRDVPAYVERQQGGDENDA